MNSLTIQTFISFFMVLLYNQRKNIEFIITIFNTHNNLYALILSLHNTLSNKDTISFQTKFIINNMFLDEYKCVFHRGKPSSLSLENIYNSENAKVAQYIKIINQSKPFQKETYHTILDYLMNFCISYDNIDNNKSNDVEHIDIDKEVISQGIVRIVLSKDKYEYFYLPQNIFEEDIAPVEEQYEHYEFYFIQRLIYKSLYELKNNGINRKRQIKLDRAFAEENIYNDILKNVFKLYGNETLMNAYMQPLNELIEISEDFGEGLTVKSFEEFMEMFIEGLKQLPKILKMVLFLIHSIACEVLEIQKNNYVIIYAMLIISFILSPRTQTLFDNKNNRVSTVIKVEKILKNICTGTSFVSIDVLSEFNGIVMLFHKKLNAYVNEEIISIDKDNKGQSRMKSYLRNVARNREFILPKFIFQIDCLNVMRILPSIPDKPQQKVKTKVNDTNNNNNTYNKRSNI